MVNLRPATKFNPILRCPNDQTHLFQRPVFEDGTIWVFDCVYEEWYYAETSDAFEETLEVIELPDILRFVEAAKHYVPEVKQKRSI